MVRVTDDWYERFEYDDWNKNGKPSARLIPTVNEVDSFNEPFYEDIIKQVTNGQALYFGYEVERLTDNEIPISTFDLNKQRDAGKKYRDRVSKYQGMGSRKYKLLQQMKQLGVENPELLVK